MIGEMQETLEFVNALRELGVQRFKGEPAPGFPSIEVELYEQKAQPPAPPQQPVIDENDVIEGGDATKDLRKQLNERLRFGSSW